MNIKIAPAPSKKARLSNTAKNIKVQTNVTLKSLKILLKSKSYIIHLSFKRFSTQVKLNINARI